MKIKNTISIGFAALAVLAGTFATADLNTRTHYRCWDDTLRVSHGGWVSYQHMAQTNCDNARAAYPQNTMWVESEQY